jgi:hypothetical protein
MLSALQNTLLAELSTTEWRLRELLFGVSLDSTPSNLAVNLTLERISKQLTSSLPLCTRFASQYMTMNDYLSDHQVEWPHI